MMYGFACKGTKGWMPLPIMMHTVGQGLDEVKKKTIPFLHPDGKTRKKLL